MNDDERAATLRSWAGRRVARGRTASLAWSVDDPEHGTLARGGAGWAVLEPERVSLEPETPFDLASLTKPLATAVLLVLAEQRGAADLDAPLGEVLPELGAGGWGGVSWLDLAAHRSGLPAWCAFGPRSRSARDVLEAIARIPPAGPRGRTIYSDLGYLLLGFALERLEGRALRAAFAERVARPLGLRRLGFAGGADRYADAAATELARSYEGRLAASSDPVYGEPVARGEVHDGNARGLGGAAGHAGLFGPLGEVTVLAQALLGPSPLGLDARARARLLHAAAPGADRTCGFALARGSAAARGLFDDDAPGHVGFTGCSIWLEPRRRRSYVLLANRVHPRVDPRGFDGVRRAFHRLARGFGRG